MQAQNLSFTLEASSPDKSQVKGVTQGTPASLAVLEELASLREQWGWHRGEWVGRVRAHLDTLGLPTRRKNNLYNLYRVLMELPLEDLRYSRIHGFCIYYGGYSRLKIAGIRGDRIIVKRRFDDLVQAGVIRPQVHENPADRFSQLILPLSHPLCQPDSGLRKMGFKKPRKRIRQKVEKPHHYKRLKTVMRLSNFLGHATLAVLQTQPGLKAKEIAEIRGVNVHTVWADLRAGRALGLIVKEKTRYSPSKGAETLQEDQLAELDTCPVARLEAMTTLFKTEDFCIRTLQKFDLPSTTRSTRTRMRDAARAKLDRIHDGEPLSIIYGLRREA